MKLGHGRTGGGGGCLGNSEGLRRNGGGGSGLEKWGG